MMSQCWGEHGMLIEKRRQDFVYSNWVTATKEVFFSEILEIEDVLETGL